MRNLRIEKKVNKKNNDIKRNLLFIIVLIVVFLLGVMFGRADKRQTENKGSDKYYAENNEKMLNEEKIENIVNDEMLDVTNDDEDYDGRDVEENLVNSSKLNNTSKDYVKDDESKGSSSETKNSFEERVDAKDTSNNGKQEIPERYEEEKENTEFDSSKGLYIEWASVKKSSIEQYRIYIKDKNGKYVSGKVEIKTIAGDVFEEIVTTDGSENIFIKSVIESVTIK